MILSSIIFQGLIFAKIAQEIRCNDPKSIRKNRIYMVGEMLWDFIRFFSLSENYSQTTNSPCCEAKRSKSYDRSEEKCQGGLATILELASFNTISILKMSKLCNFLTKMFTLPSFFQMAVLLLEEFFKRTLILQYFSSMF